ncbi:MAG: hypothetical protein PVF35_08155, partial [Gammaproteobacteria bacterium]
MVKLFSKGKLFVAGTVIASALTLWAMIGLEGCGDGNGFFKNLTLCDVDAEASLGSQTRIGGSSTVVTMGSSNWTFYNVANDLRATQASLPAGVHYDLPLEGFIHDVDLVEDPVTAGVYYALVAMGEKGITVVNVTDPANMVVVTSVDVNYEQTGITFTDGGGNIWTDNTISGSSGSITSLAVYNDASGVDQLIIANEDYGLHKTKLSNLFDTVAGREADGTLLIESEVYTLQYAGESPWGGPGSLTLYKNPNIVDDKGMLFVAMDFLGIGIFKPETLEQVGRYNLYLDLNSTEDWFVNPDGTSVDVATQVSDEVGDGTGDLFLDDFTGMPDYRQASFEVNEVWKNKTPAPIPWAEFDRYGKYYYVARKVDVATFGGQTIAYIAYGLGGVVAVDVTGYDSAGVYDPTNTTDPFANFIDEGDNIYLGYVPAIPANGPDLSTGSSSNSLYPHFGWGMLKEAGIVDVHVDIAGNRVFFSDHFAGLVAIQNADNPSGWGVAGTYDNDQLWESDGTVIDQSPLGDHWPDYEFITSYDMQPHDLADNESLPEWLYDASGPAVLVTGEVNGHGNAFMLMPTMNAAAAGQEVDIVAASGGGGINFLDIDLSSPATDDGFEVLAHLATTDEVFREADGTTTVGLSVGHSAGVTSYHNMLFLADGPHGMTVWEIADPDRCIPTDDVHLLANTLQDEYPVDGINPAPHAYDVVLDADQQNAFVLSQSRGLRRVSLADVATAEVPVLLQPLLSDIYEHNTDSGSVGGLRMQDHAYDVKLDGTLAFVADGSNGLTVYDLTKDPSAVSDYVYGNIGGETQTQPSLGHATAVALWTDTSDPQNEVKYAFVAAGHAGVGVVNVTDAANMTLVKVFEPIKYEEEGGELKVGKADGRSVDVKVVDDHVYFTYDSFGVVVYTIADLIEPLPAGMDPTDIWEPATIGERPEAVARFKLQDPLLSGSAELAELSGGALKMFHQATNGKHIFYVAYGTAGVAKIDWTDPA